MDHRSAFGNLLFVFAPVILAVPITGLALAEHHWHGSGVYISGITVLVGLGLFSAAKGSCFQAGHWVTFGSASMTRWARGFYRVGYVCMALGLAGLLLSTVW